MAALYHQTNTCQKRHTALPLSLPTLSLSPYPLSPSLPTPSLTLSRTRKASEIQSDTKDTKIERGTRHVQRETYWDSHSYWPRSARVVYAALGSIIVGISVAFFSISFSHTYSYATRHKRCNQAQKTHRHAWYANFSSTSTQPISTHTVTQPQKTNQTQKTHQYARCANFSRTSAHPQPKTQHKQLLQAVTALSSWHTT
jgi:hypothetical protein